MDGRLHQTASGRIFCRQVSGQPGSYQQRSYPSRPVLLFGVVELPTGAELERIHSGRLNDHLWLNLADSRRSSTDFMGPADVAESSITGLMTSLQWRSGALPDAVELFVRATMLPHKNEYMRWAYVAGTAAQRPRTMPQDGLYEFDSNDGFRLVSSPDPFNGSTPSSIFRECLWGPGGEFGMSTDMEPKRYAQWILGERTREASRDPQFAAFAKLMEERNPMPMVYTRDQKEQRDALATQVLAEIMRSDAEPAVARRMKP